MMSLSNSEKKKEMLKMAQNSLNSTLLIQKNLNVQLLTFMKSYMGNIQVNIDFDSDSKAFYYINTSTSMLSKSNENIKQIQDLLNTVDKLLDTMNTQLYNSPFWNEVNEFNSTFSKSMNAVYESTSTIETFLHEASTVDMQELFKNLSKAPTIETDDGGVISEEDLKYSYVENTLIISEIQKKVFLPYTIAKIQEILQNDTEHKNYTSINDVINKVYTKPIKAYRFTPISRFREAYKLMIQKEHSSKFQALRLAGELFVNFNLHPAVITACESVDQLDIYLACLEDNALEDFKYFDIKYEIPPSIVSAEDHTVQLQENA